MSSMQTNMQNAAQQEALQGLNGEKMTTMAHQRSSRLPIQSAVAERGRPVSVSASMNDPPISNRFVDHV